MKSSRPNSFTNNTINKQKNNVKMKTTKLKNKNENT